MWKTRIYSELAEGATNRRDAVAQPAQEQHAGEVGANPDAAHEQEGGHPLLRRCEQRENEADGPPEGAHGRGGGRARPWL